MIAVVDVDDTIPHFGAKARWLNAFDDYGQVDVLGGFNQNPPAAVFDHIELLARPSPKGVGRKIAHSRQHPADKVAVLRRSRINRNVSQQQPR